MTRILLADDSPHAQRMGERILRDEGYEVVTVSDGETALVRLADVDPDLVIADVYLPGRSGYEICAHIKADPLRRHARVVLTAGLLERVDEVKAAAAGADLILRKPFEASAVLAAIKPLIEAAQADRQAAQKSAEDTAAAAAAATAVAAEPAAVEVQPPVPAAFVAIAPAPVDMPAAGAAIAVMPALGAAIAVMPAPAAAGVQTPEPEPELPAAEPELPAAEPEPAAFEIDAERVRAAVTVALDRAMPALIDELTVRVLIALGK